jgi:hypothetical protein
MYEEVIFQTICGVRKMYTYRIVVLEVSCELNCVNDVDPGLGQENYGSWFDGGQSKDINSSAKNSIYSDLRYSYT